MLHGRRARQGRGAAVTLSPRMFRARVACLVAQAHCDAATTLTPADRAWAAVLDAFYAWVVAEPQETPHVLSRR